MLNIEKYAEGRELFDGQYKLLRRLSEVGGTADVWLALAVKTIDTLGAYSDDQEDGDPDEESGMKVAIKIYRLQNILDVEGEQRFKDEFKIVYNCHHANLLPPSHFSIFEDTPYLVMPYCQEGSSEKLIGKVEDNKLLWKYIHDVASGLCYLHSCHPPIIHQDIKPANVLIDSNGNYAITDFGISVKKDVDCYYEDANSGTLVYMAPERFNDNATPLPESDIWAFGATLFEIVTGDVPFGDEGGLAQANGASIPNIGQAIPQEIKKLIYACLDKNPAKRPSAQDILDFIIRGQLKKDRLKYIILTLASLLIAGVSFLFMDAKRVSPFDELCNSGDMIIDSIKSEIVEESFVVDEASRSKIVQADAFYSKAITLQSSDGERLVITKDKVSILNNVINLYTRHQEIVDTIQIAINLDYAIKEQEYKQKRDEIVNKIKKEILEL